MLKPIYAYVVGEGQTEHCRVDLRECAGRAAANRSSLLYFYVNGRHAYDSKSHHRTYHLECCSWLSSYRFRISQVMIDSVNSIFSPCPHCLPLLSIYWRGLEERIRREDQVARAVELLSHRTTGAFSSGDHFLQTVNQYHGWEDEDKEGSDIQQKFLFDSGGCLAQVVAGGKAYHRSGCDRLSRSIDCRIISMPVDYAHWCGFRPCAVCGADEL